MTSTTTALQKTIHDFLTRTGTIPTTYQECCNPSELVQWIGIYGEQHTYSVTVSMDWMHKFAQLPAKLPLLLHAIDLTELYQANRFMVEVRNFLERRIRDSFYVMRLWDEQAGACKGAKGKYSRSIALSCVEMYLSQEDDWGRLMEYWHSVEVYTDLEYSVVQRLNQVLRAAVMQSWENGIPDFVLAYITDPNQFPDILYSPLLSAKLEAYLEAQVA